MTGTEGWDDRGRAAVGRVGARLIDRVHLAGERDHVMSERQKTAASGRHRSRDLCWTSMNALAAAELDAESNVCTECVRGLVMRNRQSDSVVERTSSRPSGGNASAP